MKNIIKALVFLFINIFTLAANCQNPMFLEKDSIKDMNRWTIKAGFNTVDSNGNGSGSPINNFFKLDEEAYHGIPLKIDLEYRISEYVAVELAGSGNEWRAGEGIIDNNEILTEDQYYFAFDANVKLYYDEVFNWFNNSDWLELYSTAGIGYFKINEGGMSLNAGLGTNIWITNHFGLNFNVIGKWALDTTPAKYDTRHTQYSLGLAYRFKNQDKDNDGVYDYNDYCPNIPGIVRLHGCPEKEPYIKKETLIPIKVSSIDSDKDGVLDIDDNCPNIAGISSNSGCPPLDSDGDGVVDTADNCPKIYGDANNAGCPKAKVITSNDEVAINLLAKKIQFDSGSANFTPETFTALQSILEYINKYPNSKFKIEGHTDSIGTYQSNLLLSEKRANAVKDFFIGNGISILNLETNGFGERKPIESNMYHPGRKINRRVEIKQVN